MTLDGRPVAVVLAGGQARRMGGGDKGLLRLRRRPMLDLVLDAIRPQVGAVAINANGDVRRFLPWGLPVLADPVPGNPGPLAGILAALRWARQTQPGADLLLSVPTDTPLLPPDLVRRLTQARAQAGTAIACAASGGQRHPVVALWPVTLADPLAEALASGMRSVAAFAAAHGVTVAEFAAEPADPFLNVNEPADLVNAARVLG